MRIALIGPVYPYRAGIAYCTTRLGEELAKENDVDLVSFKRQYPKRFYPGSDDRDPSLVSKTPKNARFALDVLNPLTWIREGLALRRTSPDVAIFTWWIWVWGLPFLVMLALMRRKTRIVLQCHNISDKEPAWWKSLLTNAVLRRADLLVIHARPEAEEAKRRTKGKVRIEELFLPVHELGGAVPSRAEARAKLSIKVPHVALFFGHVRPFKGLDIALRAWRDVSSDALLLTGGEVWWNDETKYRELALPLGERVRLDFRFIPDDEIADYFAAADVVVAPYRTEAQSGVTLTAFHFARPVIASRVGGIPEIVHDGENGLLIPPEDPGTLASAVNAFFLRTDREAMERAAAQSALRYSWEEFALHLMRFVTAERSNAE